MLCHGQGKGGAESGGDAQEEAEDVEKEGRRQGGAEEEEKMNPNWHRP